DDSDELSDEREEYNAIWRRLHWGLLHIAPNEAGPLDVQPGEVHEAAEGWLESVPKALELRALLMKGKNIVTKTINEDWRRPSSKLFAPENTIRPMSRMHGKLISQ